MGIKLSTKLTLVICVYFSLNLCCSEVADCQQLKYISLQEAWQRTFLYAPSLEVAEAEVRIKDAEKTQAYLRPNPIADVELENIWGSGFYHGFNAAEITYSLWQTIELGGKRGARKNFALSQTDVAIWDAEIVKQNLYYELTSIFIETFKFQEKVKIAEERLHITRKNLEIVQAQVKAGKVSPIQERRALISVKSAEVAFREAYSLWIQSKKRLSLMWGSPCPDFETVAFSFFDYLMPASLCDLAPKLFHTPDFIKTNQAIFSASQNLKLQRANRIPDLTVRAGYRKHNETNHYAFILEAQLPIPIFNYNQGNIAKAYSEIDQAAFKREELVRELKEKIAVIYEQLIAAFDKAKIMEKGVLAEAVETFSLTQEGYQKGKLQYLDLLDAQRVLFEIQEQYTDILATYHLKKAELERWIGYQICKEVQE